jgi:serine phosphatase RsbU (regulator of sigma subunit)
VEEPDQSAALGYALKQLLLASYGLYPADVARELADACRHLGGDEVVLLLADYDQHSLVGFEQDSDRAFLVEGPGPGLAFRHEVVVEDELRPGARRLWVPVKDSAERLGVLGVVDDGSIDADHWEAIASLVGELIVSKAQYGDHITLRRRRCEFSLAAEMRWGLLPPLTFTSPDVTIAGFLQPSHGIAGDAFDYGVTGRVASVGIFDAMGHGIEASRMANVAVGAYRNARRAGADLVAVLLAVDDAIASQFGESRFVTAQLATLDFDTGAMEIVNAGHPPPLWLRTDQPPETVTCPPTQPAGLGSDPTPTVITLHREDGVLFRTDGIVDARSPTGDFFGDQQLASLIGELHNEGLPPAEILRRCLQAVVAHQNGRPSDDATLLLLRWAADTDTRSP